MELTFRDIQLEDKEIIESMTIGKGLLGWEYNFAMIWCWNVFETTKICVTDSAVFIYTIFFDKLVFFPPILSDDTKINDALTLIKDYCLKNNCGMEVNGLPENQIGIIDEEFPLTTSQDDYDYIYDSQDLRNLVGKKFHAKRNYVTRFESTYAFEFCDYSDEDFDSVIGLYDHWYVMSVHETLDLEKRAIIRALKFHKQLRLKIGLIKSEGRVIAFSVNSIVDGAAHTLFEKGDTSFVGIYQEINKLTAVNYFGSVSMVNRQEDMGIEGLRKVKLSYNPVLLLKKYSAKK